MMIMPSCRNNLQSGLHPRPKTLQKLGPHRPISIVESVNPVGRRRSGNLDRKSRMPTFRLLVLLEPPLSLAPVPPSSIDQESEHDCSRDGRENSEGIGRVQPEQYKRTVSAERPH